MVGWFLKVISSALLFDIAINNAPNPVHINSQLETGISTANAPDKALITNPKLIVIISTYK